MVQSAGRVLGWSHLESFLASRHAKCVGPGGPGTQLQARGREYPEACDRSNSFVLAGGNAPLLLQPGAHMVCAFAFVGISIVAMAGHPTDQPLREDWEERADWPNATKAINVVILVRKQRSGHGLGRHRGFVRQLWKILNSDRWGHP